MKTSSHIIRWSLVGALALAALWTWPKASGPEPAHVAEPGPKLAAPEKTAARLPPLPPTGMPIDQAVPILAVHAQSGHAGAACRLALELLRCRFSQSADSLRDLNAASAESLATQGDLEGAIRIDEHALINAERASACRRIEPRLHEQAVSHLAHAAHSGVPYAMYLYATGEHFRFREPGFAATREFDDWRRLAPGMMIAARDAGIPEAAAFLARAYGEDLSLAHSLFADNPVQANAHWQLQSLLGSGTTTVTFPFMFEQLDSAQEQESLEIARRLHEDVFDGAIFSNLSSSAMPYVLDDQSTRITSDCQGPAVGSPMPAAPEAGA